MEGIAIFESDLALPEVSDAHCAKNPSELSLEVFIITILEVFIIIILLL